MKKIAIATTNAKGQIVIPKAIRKALKISENVPLYISQQGNGVYIQPIKDLVLVREKKETHSLEELTKKFDRKKAYQALQKIKGISKEPIMDASQTIDKTLYE